MHRPFIRGILLIGALAGFASGCSSNTSSPVPTTPTPDNITEPPFQGTLTVNGAATVPFVTTQTGTATATLAALDPDPDGTVIIGLALGTWNGTTCQLVLTNDSASVGASVVGSVAGAATLCVRVYDVGKLTAPVTYTVNIVHN
jgi:hypothetical protein